MKKYAIGAAAVGVLGVLLLGWTTIRSAFFVAVDETKEAIKAAEPVENKIKRAKVLLKDIDPAIDHYLHVVATEKVAADKLKTKVEDQSKTLAAQETEMHKLAGLMKSGTGEFQFAAKTLTSETAKQELARRLRSCTTLKNTIAALEGQLKAKQQIVADGQTRLDAMKSQKEELKQKISMMEAKLAELKMKETVSHSDFNNDEMNSVSSLLEDIDDTIRIREEVAKQKGADVTSGATEETAISEEDVLKQVEEYSKPTKAAPATEEGPKT